MRKTVLLLLTVIVLAARPAAAATILTEDFEAEFPLWESGWFGMNTTAQNYYGVGGNRGNNPDGLWIADDDGVGADDLVDIQFGAFGSTLTSLDIDIAGYVPGTFRIYDSFGATLLSAPIPMTAGGYTDPGVYGHFGVLSGTGIGGFSFVPTGSMIEGNTSIDNVVVTVDGVQTVPEPTSMLLLGTGLGVLARARRRNRN